MCCAVALSCRTWYHTVPQAAALTPLYRKELASQIDKLASRALALLNNLRSGDPVRFDAPAESTLELIGSVVGALEELQREELPPLTELQQVLGVPLSAIDEIDFVVSQARGGTL